MNKYFVVHTYKGDPQEIAKQLTEAGPAFAIAMAEGKTPAINLKTWTPLPYGRTEFFFCLWEAEKPEDVIATLNSIGVLEAITADIMQVDEMDWAEVAAQAMAAMV